MTAEDATGGVDSEEKQKPVSKPIDER